LACAVVVVVAVYASVMKIGFHLTPFWSPTDRPPTRIIDEAIEVVAAASRMGFAWVSIGQHWLSHPTVWPQPLPMLARLAPETGSMRLKTSVLLLPILNPVEVAESVATLDHISHGRLDVGVAIGYRELELAVAGLARADRVPKLEESLELMKALWRGEEVTFKGRYTRVEGGRMGFTPCQKPHPPLEMGAQSEGAARRAARLTDGVFFGPQLGWADVGRFGAMFREERAALATSAGYVGASRSLIVGASKEAAAAAARGYLEKTFTMYRTWRMQESTMGRLQLGFEASLDDWTIHGSPADCVETIERARAMGLERIGFTIYSLPPEVRARIDYLQMIAERIVAPVSDARRA
jgi:alkanesulfonate monooxygenase SsuD/methylene tetrahydromethanopterin reductase-like flavin-dependent oxidoreductase (luciferase family)